MTLECIGLYIAAITDVRMHEVVLIIEDNHDLRVGQRQVLEEKGFGVFSAANGRDALRLIKDGLDPQIIILDLNMPLMDGEEFLNELRNTNLCLDTQVLVVSGYLSDMEMLTPSNKSCAIYPKPIIWNEFTDVVFNMASLYRSMKTGQLLA